MSQQGILAEHVSKIYQTRKRQGLLRSIREEKLAVNDLSFHLPPGQVIGLLGLNGAGKTTMIKMLSTLLLPTSGQITLDGLDVTRHTRAVRKRINMIAGGERMVYWRLTGRENLWYFAQLYDVEPRGLQGRIDQLLEQVGLRDAADTVVERYSKGMKQRLQIARGLINDPAYLFLDEPTIGLDAPIARDLRRMVSRLAKEGKGVLLTSHYLKEVEELCSYIYVIDHGVLVAQGSPDQLKALTHQDRVVRVLLPALSTRVEEALHVILSTTGARLSWENLEEGVAVTIYHPEDLSGCVASTIVLNGGSMLKLEVIEPTLEDAMLLLAEQSNVKELAHAE